MNTTPRFDDALAAALSWAQRHIDSLGREVYLVRDIYGRIRILSEADVPAPEALAEELHSLLGAFSPGSSRIFLARTYFTDAELSADRTLLSDRIFLIDRLVSEQGWRRAPVATPGHRPRIIFFGLKGGVGRSTALVAFAARLATLGRRVLVIDLDLESPGATSMLLGPNDLPPFGVVDWFVEDAVAQSDDNLLHAMVATSRVNERILVAPALGTRSVPDDDLPSLRDGAFIAKLGRTYASPDGAEFAVRVERLVTALERVHAPDVVLLDSRAGMHDISAAVVPRLEGTVLMFAGATSQTWLGYRLLFSAWMRERKSVAHFRHRFHVVAAQVPETGREAYLDRLRLKAYDLFAGFMYEESDAEDAFNYDVNAPDAPHSPLPIYWRRELVEWEPSALPGTTYDPLTPEQFDAAFGPFLRGAFALPYIADLTSDTQETP